MARATADVERTPTGWVGWIAFAAFFMIGNGAFNAIEGLAALIKDEGFFVVTKRGLLTFNYTGWGWIHLIFGVLLILVGIYLLRGATWARIVAIGLVGLNMISQFAFLVAQPVWATIAIALDVFVLWALFGHGDEMAA